MTVDINKLFPLPQSRNNKGERVRTYDVKITLNKSGHGRQVIRFGFLNNAAAKANGYQFVEASNVEYMKDRICFRFHNEKLHRNIHTLSKSNGITGNGYYFTITPSEAAEKIYRMNWIGKEFSFLYDSEHDWYFIEDSKEDQA